MRNPDRPWLRHAVAPLPTLKGELGIRGVTRSFDRLATLAAHPACAAAQGDGTPCASPAGACEECSLFLEHRDRLRAQEGPL
jgi:hypothetical protein